MEYVSKFVVWGASGFTIMASIIACAIACKIDIDKEWKLDEQGNKINEQGKPIKEEDIGLLGRFNSLGFGLGATVISSYLISFKDLMRDVYSNGDFIFSAIVFGIIEVIFFVICFYIVYGIMSAAKANGNDEKARRTTAAWVTIGLNLLLTFMAAGM